MACDFRWTKYPKVLWINDVPTSEGVGWAPRAHLWGWRPPQSHYGPRCLPGSGPHPAGESGAQRASEPLTGRHVRPTALVPPRVFTSCPLVTDVTTRNNTHSPSRGSQAISRNGQEGERAASERRPRGLSRGETQMRTQCGHRAQGKGAIVPALGTASLGPEDSVGTFCPFQHA